MKTQLKSMGLSLDWARELATCDPAYYKHQQKMFLDFLKAGLVAREYRKVNWDPVDQTVLANEQVIDGRGWRSGAEVEQRDLYQWVFKISDYSQELLEALDTLDRWPDKVKLMQKNWIGRSEGLLLRFMLDPATTPNKESELEIFTTRPGHVVRRQVHGAVARSSARRRRGGEESEARGLHRRDARRSAPRRRRSTPPRRWASTPASRPSIRSTRPGSCRSMSPISF